MDSGETNIYASPRINRHYGSEQISFSCDSDPKAVDPAKNLNSKQPSRMNLGRTQRYATPAVPKRIPSL
jgi:hypothetical protein